MVRNSARVRLRLRAAHDPVFRWNSSQRCDLGFPSSRVSRREREDIGREDAPELDHEVKFERRHIS